MNTQYPSTEINGQVLYLVPEIKELFCAGCVFDHGASNCTHPEWTREASMQDRLECQQLRIIYVTDWREYIVGRVTETLVDSEAAAP